jgi:hypothetical protein
VAPFFLRTQIRRGLDRIRGVRPAPATAADAAAADDAVPPARL